MFISHLAFFISVISLLLFFIRWAEHPFYERLLLIFIGLNVLETGGWLYCNYYSDHFNLWSDSVSLLSTNFSLVLPYFVVYFIGKKIAFGKSLLLVVGMILLASLLYATHLLFSNDPTNGVFFIKNNNLTYNLVIEFVIIVLSFVTFLIAFTKKPRVTNDELFDGKFKRVFFWLFVAFFTRNLLYLVVLNNSTLLSRMHHLVQSTAFDVGNILNLVVPLLLLLVSIYVNWFHLLLKLKQSNVPIESVSRSYNKSSIAMIDLAELPKTISWNELFVKYQATHPVCMNFIEELSFLSKTEKTYAFLAIFDFNQKELSDKLSVSIRTIETNMYRLRSKLKKEERELSFPYAKKKPSRTSGYVSNNHSR